MKQFFKTVFASVLGVLIASGIIIFGMFCFVIGITASMGSSSSAYVPDKNTVYKISLKGTLSDRTEQNPFAQLMGGSDKEQLSLSDLLKSIQIAKENENITGIYLEAGNLSAGSASISAIRRALKDFKESGKFVVAYGDMYTQGSYYLCSMADSLFMNPQGAVGLVGMASQGLFYTGLADKLGVEHYIFKVGTYKGAVEPLFLKKFSDANREQISSFLNSIWGNVTKEIEEDRSIAAEDLDRFINDGLAFSRAEDAVSYKLVDSLCYRYEAEKIVKNLAGQGENDKLKTASTSKILNIQNKAKDKKDKIAVLYAEGEITESTTSSPLSVSEKSITEKMADELRKLKDDKDVKAVVFRVNSPGGSAFISEQIWKQVIELKKEKPIVVSMGDMAASGGYYISCGANKIVAERGTLTGSIGVFGVIRNMTGLFDKIGLSTDMVKTNTYSDLGDASRPMREDEKALIQASVERTYDTFLTRCADGRGLTKATIDSVGQGRVWTGEQALERGLVDKLGGLDTAIEEAATLAELTDYSVTTVSGSKDFFTQFMEEQFGEMKIKLVKSMLGEDYGMFRALNRMKAEEGIRARLPFDVKPL